MNWKKVNLFECFSRAINFSNISNIYRFLITRIEHFKSFINYSYNIQLYSINDMDEKKKTKTNWILLWQENHCWYSTQDLIHKIRHNVQSHLYVLAKSRVEYQVMYISIRCLVYAACRLRLWTEQSKAIERDRKKTIERIMWPLTKHCGAMWILTSTMFGYILNISNCDPIQTHWNNNRRVSTAKKKSDKLNGRKRRI